MFDFSGVLWWVTRLSLALLSLGFLGAFWRVVRGPSLPDRVVAIELVAHITMGFLGVYAILSGHPTYLDAALVLALLSFLGTIAFARYIERRQHDLSEDQDAAQKAGGM